MGVTYPARVPQGMGLAPRARDPMYIADQSKYIRSPFNCLPQRRIFHADSPHARVPVAARRLAGRLLRRPAQRGARRCPGRPHALPCARTHRAGHPRTHGDANAQADIYGNADPDANRHRDTDSDLNGDSHPGPNRAPDIRTHVDTDSPPNPDRHLHAHTHRHTDAYPNTNPDRYGYLHSDADANRDAHEYPNAHACGVVAPTDVGVRGQRT